MHGERNIIVHSDSGHSHRVRYYFGCYDPLQYPLLLPFGDIGWDKEIQILTKTILRAYCQGQTSLNHSQISSLEDLLQKERQGTNDTLLI